MNAHSTIQDISRVSSLPGMTIGGLTTDQGAGIPLSDPARTVAARQTVFRVGDLAETSYELLEGTVILWAMLTNGRRQIVQVVKPGETFGFSASPYHLATAEAVTLCKVRPIQASVASQSLSAQQHYLQQALARIQALQSHALLLGRMTAVERVANFLLSLVPAHQKVNLEQWDSDELEIKISMTREEIGDYLGLTIETVSRNLGKLRRQGVISVDQSDRIRILDQSTLTAIADQAICVSAA